MCPRISVRGSVSPLSPNLQQTDGRTNGRIHPVISGFAATNNDDFPFKKMTDRWEDGQTDQTTDGRTD